MTSLSWPGGGWGGGGGDDGSGSGGGGGMGIAHGSSLLRVHSHTIMRPMAAPHAQLHAMKGDWPAATFSALG